MGASRERVSEAIRSKTFWFILSAQNLKARRGHYRK
jgi:hypothetical protein